MFEKKIGIAVMMFFFGGLILLASYGLGTDYLPLYNFGWKVAFTGIGAAMLVEGYHRMNKYDENGRFGQPLTVQDLPDGSYYVLNVIRNGLIEVQYANMAGEPDIRFLHVSHTDKYSPAMKFKLSRHTKVGLSDLGLVDFFREGRCLIRVLEKGI